MEDCPHDSYKAYFLRVVPSGEIKTAAHATILEILDNADANDDEIEISSSDFQASLMKLLIGFVDKTKRKKVQARSYQTEFEKWIGRSHEERQFMFHSKKALEDEANDRGVPLTSVDGMIQSLASFNLRDDRINVNENENEDVNESERECINGSSDNGSSIERENENER